MCSSGRTPRLRGGEPAQCSALLLTSGRPARREQAAGAPTRPRLTGSARQSQLNGRERLGTEYTDVQGREGVSPCGGAFAYGGPNWT